MSSQSQPSLADLEHALAVAAYLVMRHGDLYIPLLERFEREVEAARRGNPASRARRILEDYRDAGARKAIRSSHP